MIWSCLFRDDDDVNGQNQNKYATIPHTLRMDAINLANLLGAFAIRLSDEIRTSISAMGHDVSMAAALVHLAKYPGEAIEALRAPLEMSHSGCVRLVDRLEQSGYLERKDGVDARSVALHLTRNGREVAAEILRRREETLVRALNPISEQERGALARILQKLLPNEVPTALAALRACRLCDYEACRECPLKDID
jgi:MarR family transcriptional repressor of emrRAB